MSSTTIILLFKATIIAPKIHVQFPTKRGYKCYNVILITFAAEKVISRGHVHFEQQ